MNPIQPRPPPHFVPPAARDTSDPQVRWSDTALAASPRLQALRDVFEGSKGEVTADQVDQLISAAKSDAATPGTVDLLERASISLLFTERAEAPNDGATDDARSHFAEAVQAGLAMDPATAQAMASALTPSEAHSGQPFTDAVLAEVKARAALGERPRVVFDIDDTLTDSRARTLAIAHAFDQAMGTDHFANLQSAQVEYPPTETARAAGLSPSEVRQFLNFWQPRFFSEGAMDDDVGIPPMIDLAKQAAAAGADVVFLTGRPEEQRASTLAELARLGIPQAEGDHLFMSNSTDGADFKLRRLSQWAKDGPEIALFITDSQDDVKGVTDRDLPVPAVLFNSPLNGGTNVAEGTPIFDWDQSPVTPRPPDDVP